MEGILSGYRILDLTDKKGWLCSRLLADMGAEVIRIDAPANNVPKNTHYWAMNLGKLSITLNLKTRSGQNIFKKLVRIADILVESKSPKYLDRLGIGYLKLSQINPLLIMASITDFGQNGPYRDYKSSDMVASALGGQLFVTGEPQRAPLKPHGQQTYNTTCLFTAIGILIALLNRPTSTKGQYLDMSVHECVAATLDHVLVRYFANGDISKRLGSLHWNNAFRIFTCKDGYVLLTLFQQWGTLIEWLNSEGLAEDLTDTKWHDPEVRILYLDHITDVIERWTNKHTVSELVEKGQSMHFPWAEVNSIPKLIANPQLQHRGLWSEVKHPDLGISIFPGNPIKMSRSLWQTRDYLSQTGENNTQIYKEIGLSKREIKDLADQGVI